MIIIVIIIITISKHDLNHIKAHKSIKLITTSYACNHRSFESHYHSFMLKSVALYSYSLLYESAIWYKLNSAEYADFYKSLGVSSAKQPLVAGSGPLIPVV